MKGFLTKSMAENWVLGVAWLTILVSPITLVVGHRGTSSGAWKTSQVSVLAVHAPYDDWITATMVLAAIGLVSMGLSLHRALGVGFVSRVLAMFFAAAASGLGLLAYYEIGSCSDKGAHNAGLMLFLGAATAGLLASGGAVAVIGPGWWRRLTGLLVSVCAVAPVVGKIFFKSLPAGLKQRGDFLSLWIGTLLLLILVSFSRRCPASPDDSVTRQAGAGGGPEDEGVEP